VGADWKSSRVEDERTRAQGGPRSCLERPIRRSVIRKWPSGIRPWGLPRGTLLLLPSRVSAPGPCGGHTRTIAAAAHVIERRGRRCGGLPRRWRRHPPSRGTYDPFRRPAPRHRRTGPRTARLCGCRTRGGRRPATSSQPQTLRRHTGEARQQRRPRRRLWPRARRVGGGCARNACRLGGRALTPSEPRRRRGANLFVPRDRGIAAYGGPRSVARLRAGPRLALRAATPVPLVPWGGSGISHRRRPRRPRGVAGRAGAVAPLYARSSRRVGAWPVL